MFSVAKFSLLSLLSVAAEAAVVPAVFKHTAATGAAREPVGKNVTINGVQTYVSLPAGDFDNSTALLFLTDVFGLPRVDNLILADDWAAAGFATYAPDYLNGDALPQDNSVDLNTWLEDHGRDQTIPPMNDVISFLRDNGVTKLATTGYCFGGLYATLLTQNSTVEVATMAHPSLLTIPDDFEIIKSSSDVPVQIQSAELDTGLTPELADQVDQVMVGYEPGYNRTAWAGVPHGFAVAANASDPVAVAAKEGAFNSSLAWITSHL